MPTQTLKEFLEDRLRAYDPTVDLSAGSPAEEQVVIPTVNRFTPDPFEMTTEKFIDARLGQEFPEMNIQEGTGVRDFIVKPAQSILDPVIREINLIKKGQSLQNPDQLADSEVDALVANLFVGRNPGDLAEGKVRLYFNSPIAMRVTVGNVAYTASGLRFLPNRLQSISAETMLYNQSGSLFYFDIDVQAEMAGDAYNIGAGEIIGITNVSVAVRATNLASFQGGLPTETSSDLVSRAEISVTERSLVVTRGVNARLRSQFPSIEQIQVIGFGDAEMQRDLLTGGDLGESILSGNDGYADDDRFGSRTTTKFATRYNSLLPAGYDVGNFTKLAESPLYLVAAEMKYGSNGTIFTSDLSLLYTNTSGSSSFTADDVGSLIVIDGATHAANNGQFKILQVTSSYLKLVNTNGTSFTGVAESGMRWMVIRKPGKYAIASFDSPTSMTLSSSTPINRSARSMCWAIHRREVSVSMIPSGITLSAERVNISVQSSQVHLGGCSDIYVRGAGTDGAVVNLDAIEDTAPLFSARTGRTLSGQQYFFWDRPDPAQNTTSVDFSAIGVRAGDSLVVASGPDAGTRTILRVGLSNGYPTASMLSHPDYGCLQVDRPFTSTQQALSYKIVQSISMNLRRPTVTRGSGVDGQTIQGNKTFTTAGSVDFGALGVVAGDILKLTSGADAGEFTVVEVTGAGNKNLILSGYPTSTAYSLAWQVLRVQTGLTLPLVRLQSVQLLDSSRQVTGKMVPPSDPVAAISSAFSNIGRGIKLRTTKAIIGIWGRTDASTVTYPIVDTYIHFVVNGGDDQVANLSGAVSESEVLQRINALVDMDGVASFVSDSLGVRRLCLSSSSRWIYVSDVSVRVPSCDFGIRIGDDNRQVLSTDSGFSWTVPESWTETDADLRTALVPEQDSVQVLLADGTTKTMYLLWITKKRMYILDFDADANAVKFPTPTYGTTMTIGARSSGKARIYFTDPTTFEVRGAYRPALAPTSSVPSNLAAVRIYPTDVQEIDEQEPPATVFSAIANGVSLRFIPDPTLARVVIPSPEADIPNNLCSTPYGGVSGYSYLVASNAAGGVATDRQATIDFLKREVRVGDQLEITYAPIFSAVYITNTVITNLVGTALKMRIDGSVEKTLTFTDQLTAGGTSKYLQNLVDAINNFVGNTVAFTQTSGGNTLLRLEADFSLIVTPGCSAGTILGWSTTVPTSNASPSQGTYDIDFVATKEDLSRTTALLIPGLATAWADTHFKIVRPGSQRLHSTAMNTQTEHGLYYMDVELVSDGSGDLWNIPEGTSFVITGYDSEGYRLEVLDSNLSFSTEEDLNIVLSKRVLFVGQSDDPEQATSLTSQNIQISYDYSSLTQAVQEFAGANLERVTCASLLVRHLLPSYLYFTLLYQGGSSEDVVTTDVQDYLAALGPDDRVQASSVQDKATKRGATYVKNPLTLVAVGHDTSRKRVAIFSDDYVTHGRLSTFFAGNVVVTKG